MDKSLTKSSLNCASPHSWYNYNTEQAPFPCLDKLSYSFLLSLHQLPTLHPLCFQCSELSLRILSMWTSMGSFSVTSSGTSSFFSSLFSFMLIISPSLSCSGSISNGSSVNISTIRYLFYESIYVWFKFHFQCYRFLFHCFTFTFVCQFPFLILNFCKTSHGFTTRRQGSNSTIALQSVCKVNKIHFIFTGIVYVINSVYRGAN